MTTPEFFAASPPREVHVTPRYAFSVTGKTLEELGQNASRKAVALFGSKPFEFVAFDVEAIEIIGGDILTYQANILAHG